MSLKTSLEVSAEDSKIILKVINPTRTEKYRRGSNTRYDENFLEVRAVTALAEQARLNSKCPQRHLLKTPGMFPGLRLQIPEKEGRRAQLKQKGWSTAGPKSLAPPNTVWLRAQATASHWFIGESKRRMKCGLVHCHGANTCTSGLTLTDVPQLLSSKHLSLGWFTAGRRGRSVHPTPPVLFDQENDAFPALLMTVAITESHDQP